MEYLVYFLTLLGLFCAAFFVIAIFTSRLLDRVVVLPVPQKEPEKGDEASVVIGGQKTEAIIEDIIYEEGNLTRKIVLRTLR